MSHKEVLRNYVQQMKKIVTKTRDSPDGTLENEKEGGLTEEDRLKLKGILQEMGKTVEEMPTAERQSQSKGIFSGFSSPFGGSPKPVQFFMPEETPRKFPEALSKLCKEMSYKCEIRRRTEELHSDEPLIVVCPITSRLEPDIDHILIKLKWSSAYVTLVLHYGNESSQPGLPTATRLPEKEIYQQTQFVDMLVTSESTLNPYPINVAAKENIKRFLDNYYKK